MTPSETATWRKIRELASRFQKADRIALGIPMWNFPFPYKLRQLIDLVVSPFLWKIESASSGRRDHSMV